MALADRPMRRPFQRRSPTGGAAAQTARQGRAHPNPTPGRVTALEAQVKRPNRFNLYIDDHFAMGLSALVAATVRVGQELSRADLEKLAYAQNVEEAHDRALGFLAVRPRSEREVRQYLKRKNYSEEVIDQILTRLAEVQLVGDRDFAKYWVENREGFKPRSKRALQYELRQKGVSPEEIARAVQRVDERDSAYRAAHARAQRWKDLDAQTFREKLSGFLARRGFDYTVTRETVNRLWQELNGTTEPLNEPWEEE